MISQRKMKRMTRSSPWPPLPGSHSQCHVSSLHRSPDHCQLLWISSSPNYGNHPVSEFHDSPSLPALLVAPEGAFDWFEKNLIFYQPKVFKSFSILLKSLALLLGPTPHLLWLDWNWYKPGGPSDQTNHLRFSILHVLRQQRHILRQSHSHTVRAGRSRGCKRQTGEGILIPGRKI